MRAKMHRVPVEQEDDDLPRICVEPGPSMRWLEQGFFMGIGFICANLIVGAFAGIIFLIVAAWP